MDKGNRIVLITGGGGEIGSAIARKFATEGYLVIITYHSNEAKAKKVLSELSGEGHWAFHAPNTDPQKIQDLTKEIAQKHGHLHVLVNNAGITIPVPHHDLESLSDEWIDRIMQTNFRGGFAMTRACKDVLLAGANAAGQSSCIINISSIAGQFGMGSNVAYCASKAAVDSMTKSLARALAPAIRVVSVSPGFVEGEYTRNFSTSFLKEQKDKTPLERFANANDVADAVFAASNLLTFTTGSIINVDGGRLLK
ncbi:MAG: hypothetical protein RJA76_1448 [Bacteroidota bacterium]|jgi:3-oxoacyl-[acyl-carrier protein] reductase